VNSPLLQIENRVLAVERDRSRCRTDEELGAFLAPDENRPGRFLNGNPAHRLAVRLLEFDLPKFRKCVAELTAQRIRDVSLELVS
jgi:hypothetical protein